MRPAFEANRVGPVDGLFPGPAEFVNRPVCFPTSSGRNIDDRDCKFRGRVDLISSRSMTSGAGWLAVVLPAEPRGSDAVRLASKGLVPPEQFARHDLPMRVRPELVASLQLFPLAGNSRIWLG